MATFSMDAPLADWNKLVLACMVLYPEMLPAETNIFVTQGDINTPLYTTGVDVSLEGDIVTQLTNAQINTIINNGIPTSPSIGYAAGANALDYLRDVVDQKFLDAVLSTAIARRKEYRKTQDTEAITTGLDLT